MRKTVIHAVIVAIGCFVLSPAVHATGPDVIVGELSGLTDYARLGDTAALAVGTTSCNAGDEQLNWFALPSNQHPVIAQNFYRLLDGRLEQVGQAWLKHGFTALQGTTCFADCQPSGTGSRLGIHCSDPYSASLNSGPGLGPRSEVNPVDGYFDGATANNHTGHTHTSISHGLQVKHADLGNAGARYFIEGHYIAPDDAVAGNGNNNASYREYSVSGDSSNWSFSPIGSTVREQPAINVWPGATRVILDSFPEDGRIVVAYRIVSLGGGQFRYDYAVYNMNSNRGIRSFSVPVGAAVISNIGFHAPLSHDEGLSNDPWTATIAQGGLTWTTPAYDADPNANAIRWGTMYNFWFDANVGATTSTAQLGRFKPGLGPAFLAATVNAPAAPDCNNNGIPDASDIGSGFSNDCNANGLPDECETQGNDCNADLVPDDCQTVGDCNTNGVPDVCDAVAGNDCDANLVPDECQPDCDFNGVIDPCESAPDCNANNVPDSCDVTGLVGGINNYDSGTINVSIPDNNPTGASHTLNVPAPGIVEDVNVRVNITHTWDSDLTLYLVHNGTTVTLAQRVGGSGDNFTNTVFDDEAAISINSGSPPFSGSYRPHTPLSAFDGGDAQGGWTLRVVDSVGADVGTLRDWTLTVQTVNEPPTSEDANGNMIPDECECPTCPGDVDGDGDRDGDDILGFVAAAIGSYDTCADMNVSGPPLSEQDVDDFVASLLNDAGPCP